MTNYFTNINQPDLLPRLHFFSFHFISFHEHALTHRCNKYLKPRLLIMKTFKRKWRRACKKNEDVVISLEKTSRRTSVELRIFFSFKKLGKSKLIKALFLMTRGPRPMCPRRSDKMMLHYIVRAKWSANACVEGQTLKNVKPCRHNSIAFCGVVNVLKDLILFATNESKAGFITLCLISWIGWTCIHGPLLM